MADSIQLPPMVITPDPDFGSSPSFGTPQLDPHFPPVVAFNNSHGSQRVYANGTKFFPLVNAGRFQDAMIALLQGLNGLTAQQTLDQLSNHAKTQVDLANAPAPSSQSLTSEHSIRLPSATEIVYGVEFLKVHDKPIANPTSYDFFGTPIMSAAGGILLVMGRRESAERSYRLA